MWKRNIYIFIIAIGIWIWIYGCSTQDNNDENGSQIPSPELINFSVSENCSEWNATQINVDECNISIEHYAMFGASADSIVVNFEVSAETLKIIEKGYQSSFDDSICYFCVSADILVYMTGTYYLKIFRQINEGVQSLEWSGNVNITSCGE
ncbi:hypothetical protein DRQ33_00040 [bacterium]|nr:MAG: hypothetical protein DRQ33_00040 [bacterium]